MLSIYNPTDSVLSISYLGSTYEVGPKGDMVVPADVALYWKKYIHQFLVVSAIETKEWEEVTSESVVVMEDKPTTVARAVKQAVIKKRASK